MKVSLKNGKVVKVYIQLQCVDLSAGAAGLARSPTKPGPTGLVSPKRPWPGRACQYARLGPMLVELSWEIGPARPGETRPCRHPCTCLRLDTSFD